MDASELDVLADRAIAGHYWVSHCQVSTPGPNWGPDPSWGVLGGGNFLQKCVKKQKFCLKMREKSRFKKKSFACGEQLS